MYIPLVGLREIYTTQYMYIQLVGLRKIYNTKSILQKEKKFDSWSILIYSVINSKINFLGKSIDINHVDTLKPTIEVKYPNYDVLEKKSCFF